MITAETITDAQIAEVIDIGNEILRNAHAALDRSISGREARHKARARCAEILNARNGKP
jgi:hypothetical protein